MLTLTPADVCRFFSLKAFGTPTPDADAKPTCGRSSSLESYKKEISFFMPNRLIGWNVQTKEGNPTKSVAVNNLIKKVKKLEVRKLGVSSQARRPLEIEELGFIISLLRKDPDPVKRYGFVALVIMQFHFLARVDDTCKIMIDEIRRHSTYDDALRARLCWCKNVMDERAAPPQIMFASNNFNFCPILNLAIYLESLFPTETNQHGAVNLFGSIASTPEKIKSKIQDHLREKIFSSEDFLELAQKMSDEVERCKKVGTHSIRKLAATFARRNGCSKDDVNTRGRWKRLKQMVDSYIANEIPYPDAKAAAALCIGSAIKYELKKDCGVDEDWICQYVVPEIAEKLGDKRAAFILGKALLWACLDPEVQDIVPLQLYKRVNLEYERVRVLDSDVNPVRKAPLVICGHEGRLIVEELIDHQDDGTTAHDEGSLPRTPEDINRRRSRQSSEMQVVLAQLMMIRKQNEELQNEFQVFKSHISKRIRYLNDSVKRLTTVPARVSKVSLSSRNEDSIGTNNISVHDEDDGEESNWGREGRPAELSKNPRSLYTLWHEYEFGIGSRKAAKDFDVRDRGANRYNYSKRKVFWDLVSLMVRRGRQANEAIDELYKYYGYKTSLTNILKAMRKERMEGSGFAQFFVS